MDKSDLIVWLKVFSPDHIFLSIFILTLEVLYEEMTRPSFKCAQREDIESR